MTVVYVMTRAQSRLIKEVHAAKMTGWKVYLVAYKSGPEDYKKWFDDVFIAENIHEAMQITYRINPDIIHCFCWIGDQICATFVDAFPGRTIFDPLDVGVMRKVKGKGRKPLLMASSYQIFCLSRAAGICARDLRVNWLKRLGYIPRKNRMLLYSDYCWNMEQTEQKKKKPDELHCVVIGTFGMKEDNCYLEIAELLSSQGIHVHMYASHAQDRESCERHFQPYLELEEKNNFIHMHMALPYEQLLGELQKFDFGLHLIKPLLDGRTLENYLPEEFTYTAISMRESDYIDTGLPVITCNGRNLAIRQMSKYGACKVADWNLLRNGRKELETFINHPELPSNLKRLKSEYSIETQAPRLDAFYKNICGAGQRFFALGTKWEKKNIKEHDSNINKLRGILSGKRVLIVSAQNEVEKNSNKALWRNTLTMVKQQSGSVQMITDNHEADEYKRHFLHDQNGWCFTKNNIPRIVDHITKDDYRTLSTRDLELGIESDLIEFNQNCFSNPDKCSIDSFDLVFVDDISVAFALYKNGSLGNDCHWGYLFDQCHFNRDLSSLEKNLLNSASLVLCSNAESELFLKNQNIINVYPFQNERQILVNIRNILGVLPQEEFKRTKRAVIVDSGTKDKRKNIPELLRLISNFNKTNYADTIILGQRPKGSYIGAQKTLPVFSGKAQKAFANGWVEKGMKRWSKDLLPFLEQYVSPGDQVIAFQQQPVELWAWATALSKLDSSIGFDITLHFEIQDLMTAEGPHLAGCGLQFLNQIDSRYNIDLLVNDPLLENFVREVCSIPVRVMTPTMANFSDFETTNCSNVKSSPITSTV